MNSKSFDDLARGLAKRSSRRHIFKLAVSGLVGVAIGRGIASPVATQAPPCDVPFTSTPANHVSGSCQDLGNYIARTGVTDKNGKNHKGSVGWTGVEIVTNYESDYDGTTKNGQVCIVTKRPVSVAFSSEPTIMRLYWQPDAPSVVCNWEVNTWVEKIHAHECRHVRDAETLVKAANDNWVPTSYRACAATQAEAEEALKETIDRDIVEIVSQIEKDFETLSTALHSSPEGEPNSLACTLPGPMDTPLPPWPLFLPGDRNKRLLRSSVINPYIEDT